MYKLRWRGVWEAKGMKRKEIRIHAVECRECPVWALTPEELSHKVPICFTPAGTGPNGGNLVKVSKGRV